MADAAVQVVRLIVFCGWVCSTYQEGVQVSRVADDEVQVLCFRVLCDKVYAAYPEGV